MPTPIASPAVGIEYRLWYIREELGKPRLSRQRREDLMQEVAELEASLGDFLNDVSDRLGAVADRMEAALDRAEGGNHA